MASSAALGHTSHAGMGRRAAAGAAGGIAGGVAFGILMAMMGMLPMVAMLVGSDSAAVGFGVHMAISIAIGLGLTLALAGQLTSYARGGLIGLGYGALWWVLGPLLIMPAMMGMPVFTIDAGATMSLVGHLIYGVILGLVAVRVLHSRP